MIAQKISFAFFTRLLILGLGYISLFFVAHYMGPEAVGIIAFALSYVGIFQSFSDFGFGSAHIKRVSEGKDLGKCNGTYFAIKVVLTVFMTAIILSTIFISKVVRNGSFISKDHETVLYIIILSAVISNFYKIFSTTFGAKKEIGKQQVPLLVGKIFEVAGKVVVAVIGLSVVLLAGASLISSFIILLFLLYLFRHYPIKKPDKKYFKSYASFAIPVMFIGFLSSFAQNVDKVMIQFFWNTGEVGYYSAAQRISFMLAYLTTASIALIFPTISSYYSEGNIEKIRNLSNKAERYISMVLFPAVAFIFVFSRPICHILLSQKFLPSASILVVLSVVALINGISQPYTQQIGGTNRIVLAAKLSSVIFTLNIFLNFLFIPSEFLGIRLLGMGGIGAAFSTLISISLGSVLFRYYAYRISLSKPNPSILLHLIASIIMGSILYFISSSLPMMTWYYIILFAGIGGLLYFFILAVLKEFTRKDINLFVNVLNPAKLSKYAISEIRSGYEENLP